jgi:hypothetical protein
MEPIPDKATAPADIICDVSDGTKDCIRILASMCSVSYACINTQVCIHESHVARIHTLSLHFMYAYLVNSMLIYGTGPASERLMHSPSGSPAVPRVSGHVDAPAPSSLGIRGSGVEEFHYIAQ